MSELKSCRVSFTDLEGIEHAATVTAESLMEAAALGLKALGEGNAPAGTASVLKVQIYQPIVEHAVQVSRLWSWMKANPKSPKEALLKNRLKAMFAGHDE